MPDSHVKVLLNDGMICLNFKRIFKNAVMPLGIGFNRKFISHLFNADFDDYLMIKWRPTHDYIVKVA